MVGFRLSPKMRISLFNSAQEPGNGDRQNTYRHSDPAMQLFQYNKIQCFPALLGNERKGRYVALLCHDSLMFKRLINQELRQR